MNIKVVLLGLLLGLMGIFNINCASERLYGGKTLPNDQIATLHAGNNVRIISVDGKAVKQENYLTVEVLPGEHTAVVQYFNETENVKYRKGDLFLISYQSKKPIAVTVLAEAGKSYDIKGSQLSDGQCIIEVKEGFFLSPTTVASAKGLTEEVYSPYYDRYPYYDYYYYYDYPFFGRACFDRGFAVSFHHHR